MQHFPLLLEHPSNLLYECGHTIQQNTLRAFHIYCLSSEERGQVVLKEAQNGETHGLAMSRETVTYIIISPLTLEDSREYVVERSFPLLQHCRFGEDPSYGFGSSSEKTTHTFHKHLTITKSFQFEKSRMSKPKTHRIHEFQSGDVFRSFITLTMNSSPISNTQNKVQAN